MATLAPAGDARLPGAGVREGEARRNAPGEASRPADARQRMNPPAGHGVALAMSRDPESRAHNRPSSHPAAAGSAILRADGEPLGRDHGDGDAVRGGRRARPRVGPPPGDAPGRERLARPGRGRHHRRVADALRRREAAPPRRGPGRGRRPRDGDRGHGLQRHPSLGRADRAAAKAGAHAVLVVTPYYNKPSRAGLRAHFHAVAEAAGETPVVLYNIPSRCVINVPPDLLADLAREIPNVVGRQAGQRRGPRADRGAERARRQRRWPSCGPWSSAEPAGSSWRRTSSAARCGRCTRRKPGGTARAPASSTHPWSRSIRR